MHVRPFLIALLVTAPSAVHAAMSFVPTWIKNDPAKNAVHLDVAAEWNGNNDWANFNGYFRGNATVLIPAGADVTVDFHLIGDHWPHSLMLTAPYDPADLPIKLSEADAVEGIASRKAIYGMEPGENDQLHFVTKPGTYWLVSSKGTDLSAGMWIVIAVKTDLKRAELLVDSSSLGDLQARK
jgi:hypothetical protein